MLPLVDTNRKTRIEILREYYSTSSATSSNSLVEHGDADDDYVLYQYDRQIALAMYLYHYSDWFIWMLFSLDTNDSAMRLMELSSLFRRHDLGRVLEAVRAFLPGGWIAQKDVHPKRKHLRCMR